MSMNKASRRQRAVVSSVFCGDEDGRWVTAWVHLDIHGSGMQGFGGVVLDERTSREFQRQIIEVFGFTLRGEAEHWPNDFIASCWKALPGRQCFILRCWGTDERIDGIEVDGRRFLMSRFIREMWPERAVDEYEHKQQSLLRSIKYHTEQIEENTKRLFKLKSEYLDWEKEP
ncbi:MAG: hypothetical protein ACYDH4_10935 [Candidatus Cryosericum sp.]